MLVEAHIGGLPIEETALALLPMMGFVLAGAGAMAAAWRRRWREVRDAVRPREGAPEDRLDIAAGAARRKATGGRASAD
jgi:hypothetical protein